MTDHYQSQEWRDFDLGHPGGEATTRWLLEKSQLEEAHILDFCCGAGDSLIILKQKKHQVKGIDRPGVLKHAQAKHPDLKAEDLFPWEEGQRIPFEDQTFDAVLSECSLSIMENKDRVLEEIHRILKDRGLLLISDMTEAGPFELNDFELSDWSDQSKHIKPFIARWVWMTEKKYPRTCQGNQYFCGIYQKR